MTLRNAPLSGRDGASRRFDLPDGESEIFLQMGLDSRIHQGRADLPVGQISSLPSPRPLQLRGASGMAQEGRAGVALPYPPLEGEGRLA
jgi:hypothetical protein